MKPRIKRRDFLATTAFGALASPSLLAEAQVPQILTKSAARPIVISSANGNISRDAEGLTCVTKAFKMITSDADVLDAVVAGVNIVELDPEDTRSDTAGCP